MDGGRTNLVGKMSWARNMKNECVNKRKDFEMNQI